MNIINFQNANCTHCYKCLRNCEVKAIRIHNGQAQIMSSQCVFCGHCTEICPQNAKTFESDLDKVKRMLKEKESIVVSIDPSYRGILKYQQPGQIVTALLKLGFAQVRETAEGAALVTDAYFKLLEEGTMDNVITTACPSANSLIEKYYPELIPYMAPVISPMIAHGKLIKQLMGEHTKVVFIGPCVAAKVEAEEDSRTKGIIDGVIDFIELEDWFAEENIEVEKCESSNFSNPDPMVNQLYPVNGGILRSVTAKRGNNTYQRLSVTGIVSCREFLHSMKRGYVEHCFVELRCCEGGCVNGPCVNKRRGYRFKSTLDIERSALYADPGYHYQLSEKEINQTFIPRAVKERMPSEGEIQKILKTIGKGGRERELNCGACGYPTCREKAIAIFQGKAESSMCLLNSYEKARSMANVVIETTPKMILILDAELKIREFNKMAEEVFHIPRAKALQMYMFDLMDPSDFEEVFLTHEDVLRRKKVWKDKGYTVLETIVYIEEQDMLLTIIENVTEEEKRKEEFMDKKLETVKMAQAVIDKQMTTAQEIAGLLGETTAETKAILTKLRNYMLKDEDV